MPHPSEAKIHFRIQTRGPPAKEVLKQGLEELEALFTELRGKFAQAMAAQDYEHDPELVV